MSVLSSESTHLADGAFAPIPPMDERCLIRTIDRWCSDTPEKTAILFQSHNVTFTYRELWADVARIASGLSGIGLEVGDRVATILHNSPEYLLIWLACEYAGLVTVSINPGASGRYLAHSVKTTSPKVVACDKESCQRLEAVAGDIGSLVAVIDVGPAAQSPTTSFRHLPFDRLDGVRVDPEPIDPRVPSSIRFTSGTTGPAKAVGFSESQMAIFSIQAAWLMGYSRADRLYTPLPLHHSLASMNGAGMMLRIGGSCAVDDRFHASDYWDRVYRCEATATQTSGPLVAILLAQPKQEHESDHLCRRGQWGTPNADFTSRFGVSLTEAYSQSEGNWVFYTPPGETPRPGSTGRLSPWFDARVVDTEDEEVPRGTSGELVWRPKVPHSTMVGYFGDNEATVRAWRNLWYHTGDAGRIDENDYFYLDGRVGDQIRRKGVNISAETVEAAACEHDDVVDAAAIAVPSTLGESEVKLCVTTGAAPEILAFVTFLQDRLPAEMVPRYIEFRSELPMTANGKVQKYVLRNEGDRGITEATVDVESMTKSKPRLR